MALLGWAPPVGKDFLNREELENLFDATNISAAPAILSEEKLEDLNARHIRAKESKEFVKEIKPWLEIKTTGAQQKVLGELLQERITNYGQISKMVKPLLETPLNLIAANIPEELDKAQMVSLWTRVGEIVERDGLEDPAALNEIIKAEMKKLEIKGKYAWKMLYLGILHSTTGLPLYQAMQLMGQKEVLSRLASASRAVKELDGFIQERQSPEQKNLE
jgi:glutamyl/glutaminyl-tRNA synthetase